MKKHWFIAMTALLLFCVFCVTATALIIQKRQPAPVAEEEIIQKGIDLYGTYDQNDLVLEQVILSDYGKDVAVLQVSGMRDAAVEKAVNDAIMEKTKALLNDLEQVDFADYYVASNFANVLSVSFYVGGDTYRGGYLNLDLNTGKPLHLSDLFYEDVDLLSIVRHAFYKTLAQQNAWGHEGVAFPDENKLYQVVTAYFASDNPQFYFTPAQVYFCQGDLTATVDFIDIAKDVAIYEKYLGTESLFTRNDVGFKNLFTCAVGNYDMFEVLEYGYLQENLWYDITMWSYPVYDATLASDALAAMEEMKQDRLEKSRAIVEEYRQKATENPDMAYILLLRPGYDLLSIQHYHAEGWHTQYAHAVDSFEQGMIYEMPKSVFESTYKDRVIKAYRNKYFALSGGAYLSGEDHEDTTITQLNVHELVNYKTGHVYSTLDEVFAVDEDYYMTLLRARVVEHLTNWHSQRYTRSQAEAMAEKMTCQLNGAYIHITVPETDLTPIYRLTEFDSAYLTIFPKEEA